MIERQRLIQIDWRNRIRPIFTVVGTGRVEERVLCFPMEVLIEDPEAIPLPYDKVVIIGAVEPEIRQAVATFLEDAG